MLRRIPATLLVCLVVFMVTVFSGAAWAAGPDESLEVLLKPGKQGTAQGPAVQKAASRRGGAKFKSAGLPPMMIPYPPMYEGICKVKPAAAAQCFAFPPMAPPCILAAPGPRQWELSAQAFFATIRGRVVWPRYNPYGYGGYWGMGDGDGGANLVDNLQLPRHDTIPQFSALYQFRPNWGVRYTVLFKEFVGGGTNSNYDYFWFGSQFSNWGYGQSLQSKWQHAYHRLGIQYDALRTCNAKFAVFADWVHMDDRIDVGCTYCGWGSQTFSKSTDAMSVGLELRRCLKTMPNGGTFSCEGKISGIFIDNVEGMDLEVGGRYSIPVSAAGRWGYLKGGYRVIDIKKSQNDYIFKHALEGGFVEMGFIF